MSRSNATQIHQFVDHLPAQELLTMWHPQFQCICSRYFPEVYMFLILPWVDPPIGYLGMLVGSSGTVVYFGALEQLQVLTLATDPIYCIHTISNCNIHERHQPTPQTPVRSRLSPRKPWWMWRWIWVCHRCFMKGRLGPVRSAEGN
jgi:hypothetical protein